MNTSAIILAAGPSSRMGQSKQMLDIDGEKLLVKTIRTILNAGVSSVVVVLGSDEKKHRDLIKDLPVDIILNPNWANGMGSSIKTGLQYLTTKNPSLQGVIVSVCDQPLVSTQNISNLIRRYEETGKPIIASRYLKIRGVPVLFDKTYFPKLMALPDDQGAKKIIQQNPEDVSEVDFPGGEIDLDTMEDYEAFRNR